MTWKKQIRDYWYSLQDISDLPESKRVELKNIIKDILDEKNKHIEEMIKEKLKNAPLEVQMSGSAIILLKVIKEIKK